MSIVSNDVKANSIVNYNKGGNVYYNSLTGMIITGIFPFFCIGMYIKSKKNIDETMISSAVYGIGLGFILSIIYGILWSLSKKDAVKHPDEQTDGPEVYRGVFFANVAMLIIGCIIMAMWFLIEKKRGRLNQS